jgi:hypothetical protein
MEKRDEVKLTDAQVLLLVALDRPASAFWYRRANGRVQAGRRSTLCSLNLRGMVGYAHGGWYLTDAGREAIAQISLARREAAYREIESVR